ncbi:DUF3987 domain-containing protein [Endozoicomonas acroporae]|uniref:DUF3987 domain-containing protein n=1 Tax=Endozoicomonas acroporae TaxID=1701104 RepID=UPI0013D16EB1|nr:DUF3987 domain-containing protein [Endozoicomonas acroporae]
MSIQSSLQDELAPAEVLTLEYQKTVRTLTSRAPELVEQLQKMPEALIELAKQIEDLDPLPLKPEEAQESSYPTEALLGMDQAVFDISDRLKVSPALAGQCALGLANGIIQGLVDVVKPANPTPKPCSLFLLTGADSGEGKTLVDDILSSRLQEQSIQTDLAYQEKREDYDMCLKAYHCEVKKIEQDKKLTQEEREQAFRETKKPLPPMNPRLKLADVTIEGIARQFKEGCTRLGIMTDEGAVLFGNHALVNERRTAVMGRFCKMWDGGQWDVDRGTQENNFSLIGRRLSMSISTQPDILRSIMADTLAVNQGFLPRFLVAMPNTRVMEKRMIQMDWASLPSIQDYWSRLSGLYDITPATRDDHPLVLNPRKLTLTPKACKLHEAFGNQCFKDAGGKYETVRAMALKAEDNLLRLAATLTIWNTPTADKIDAEAVEAASYLMKYYLDEGLRIADYSSELSDDSDLTLASELLKWVTANGAYLVHSMALTQQAPKRSMRKARTIERVMNILVEHGHAIRLNDKPVIEGKPRLKAWLITS